MARCINIGDEEKLKIKCLNWLNPKISKFVIGTQTLVQFVNDIFNILPIGITIINQKII